jgi:sortase A
MNLYRPLLLLLLGGATLAGGLRYADLASRASNTEPNEPVAALPEPTEEPPPLESLPLPALPQPGLADPLLEQAHVIPPLPPRVGAFTTRTLPPEKVQIPSIDLDARVIPLGTHFDRTGSLAWETAPFAVGHHRGSANPGETGNVVLSGHISSPSEGAIFQRLPQVKPGDNLIMTTAQASFLYRVWDVRVVVPTAVEFIESTSTSTATLITCYPDRIYSHRLIVRAQAV